MPNSESVKRVRLTNKPVKWSELLPTLSNGVLARIESGEQRRLKVGEGVKATIGRRVRIQARRILRRRTALDDSKDSGRRRFYQWFNETYTVWIKPQAPGCYFYHNTFPVAWLAVDDQGVVISQELIWPGQHGSGLNLFIQRHMGDVKHFDLDTLSYFDPSNLDVKRGD